MGRGSEKEKEQKMEKVKENNTKEQQKATKNKSEPKKEQEGEGLEAAEEQLGRCLAAFHSCSQTQLLLPELYSSQTP